MRSDVSPPIDRVLTRCLSCYAAFPANDVLEALRVGVCVAFDPARGRLWVVCRHCTRWTLVPIECRWEAIDELERLCRDRARLLRRGENVALHALPGLDIIRVGRAGLHEESWWRYGEALLTRAERARAVARRGKVIDTVLMLLLTGLPIWGLSDPAAWIDRARRGRFGRAAWRGTTACVGCGAVLRVLPFADRNELIVERAGAQLELVYTCATCADSPDAGHHWKGVEAEHVLRRVLAYENFAGASAEQVTGAIQLIDAHRAPERLVGHIADARLAVGQLSEDAVLAAEIALNADLEARLLETEIDALEYRWRQEEQLAAIIDGELTSPPRT